MEHIFILKGLDCPNCSAKIEKEVGELAGVQLSSMNLMKQTLTVQAEASVTNLLDTVTTIVHSHEPDVEVSEKPTASPPCSWLSGLTLVVEPLASRQCCQWLLPAKLG